VGLYKTPKNTFSATLVGFVGTNCQKSDLNLKNTPKALEIAPCDHTPGKIWFFWSLSQR